MSKAKAPELTILHIANIEDVQDDNFREQLKSWREDVLSFETCKRHIYIAHGDKINKIGLPEASKISSEAKVEKLIGSEAYSLLLRWSVGLLHVEKNRFAKGDIRKRWTELRDQNSDILKGFEPIMNRIFKESRHIRELIDGEQHKDSPLKTRVELAERACNNCVRSWEQGEEQPPFAFITSLASDYKINALKEQLRLTDKFLSNYQAKTDRILPSDKTADTQSAKTNYYSFERAFKATRQKSVIEDILAKTEKAPQGRSL